MAESTAPPASAPPSRATPDAASAGAGSAPEARPGAAPAAGDVAPSALPISERPGRLLSLDVFRGATIAAMLLVNNPGSWSHIYAPLEHATWNGWTPTDLIFPFFVFIVGVAAVFSFGKRRARGAERLDLVRKVATRAAIIFLIGLVMNGFPSYNFGEIRIMGVLQRIALAYLVGGLLLILLDRAGQIVAAAALLLGYWLLQTRVPVPGTGGPGALEPGLDLGSWIDRSVLGTQHMWVWSKTWDPEGLLSTMGAVATLLVGAQVGRWLRSDRSAEEKTIGLFAAGNVLLGIGAAWGAVFAINKNLWTGSYVLFTGGFAMVLLALCYWAVDVKRRRGVWTLPFVVFGTNAIAAFFLSGIVTRSLTLTHVGGTTTYAWLYETLFLPWLSPVNASLAFAVTYVLVFLGLMGILYRRRIFLRV